VEARMSEPLDLLGTSRDVLDERFVLVGFSRPLTKDELCAFYDYVRNFRGDPLNDTIGNRLKTL